MAGHVRLSCSKPYSITPVQCSTQNIYKSLNNIPWWWCKRNVGDIFSVVKLMEFYHYPCHKGALRQPDGVRYYKKYGDLPHIKKIYSIDFHARTVDFGNVAFRLLKYVELIPAFLNVKSQSITPLNRYCHFNVQQTFLLKNDMNPTSC